MPFNGTKEVNQQRAKVSIEECSDGIDSIQYTQNNEKYDRVDFLSTLCSHSRYARSYIRHRTHSASELWGKIEQLGHQHYYRL